MRFAQNTKTRVTSGDKWLQNRQEIRKEMVISPHSKDPWWYCTGDKSTGSRLSWEVDNWNLAKGNLIYCTNWITMRFWGQLCGSAFTSKLRFKLVLRSLRAQIYLFHQGLLNDLCDGQLLHYNFCRTLICCDKLGLGAMSKVGPTTDSIICKGCD